jgi:hypothetical protein
MVVELLGYELAGSLFDSRGGCLQISEAIPDQLIESPSRLADVRFADRADGEQRIVLLDFYAVAIGDHVHQMFPIRCGRGAH